MVPNSQEEAMMKAMELQMEPVKMLEEALKSFRKGLALYKQAAPLEPANNELSTNFAVLYRDITRVQGYLDYLKAYQTAIETTLAAVTQEKRFLKSLEREVTTKEEVNKAAINESSNAIDDLVKKALAIKEKPTLLPEEGLKDYKLALEDIPEDLAFLTSCFTFLMLSIPIWPSKVFIVSRAPFMTNILERTNEATAPPIPTTKNIKTKPVRPRIGTSPCTHSSSASPLEETLHLRG